MYAFGLDPFANKYVNPIETDVDISAPIHPLTKDICIFTGKASIINAVKNLVVTRVKDRLFNDAIAIGGIDLTFKNMYDVFHIYNFEAAITELLNTVEPRIADASCSIKVVDENSLNVLTTFTIVETREQVDYNFHLNRLR